MKLSIDIYESSRETQSSKLCVAFECFIEVSLQILVLHAAGLALIRITFFSNAHLFQGPGGCKQLVEFHPRY